LPLPPEVLPDEVEQGHGSWLEIWRQPYLNRTIMLIVFNLLQSIGYNGFVNPAADRARGPARYAAVGCSGGTA
jgi:hypothetical protein